MLSELLFGAQLKRERAEHDREPVGLLRGCASSVRPRSLCGVGPTYSTRLIFTIAPASNWNCHLDADVAFHAFSQIVVGTANN